MDTPTCVVCHRDLWHTEHHRYACRPCETRTAEQLNGIPRPVSDLEDMLAPGARFRADSGGRGPSRVHSPMPCDIDVLSLLAPGGIIAGLDTWVRDWCDRLEWSVPAYRVRPIDEAAAFLRRNLPWAVECHPAVDEFATEISDLVREVTAITDPPDRALRLGHCPQCAAATASEPRPPAGLVRALRGRVGRCRRAGIADRVSGMSVVAGSLGTSRKEVSYGAGERKGTDHAKRRLS